MQAEHAEQQRQALEGLESRQEAMLKQQAATAAELRAFKEHASGLLTTLQTQASSVACVMPSNPRLLLKNACHL